MSSEIDFPRSNTSQRNEVRSDMPSGLPKGKAKKRRAGKQKEKAVKPPEKKPKIEGTVDAAPTVAVIESLKPKSLCVGLVTLGCVREVKDFQVVVGLPGGLSGIIPITMVQDAYTQQLQRLAQDTEQEAAVEEEVASLSELFKPGSILPCCVMEITKTKKGNKSVKLSVRPSDLYSSLTRSSLRSEMLLYASVSSCEDHGYVVDLGVKGTSAFLPHSKAAQFVQAHNQGETMKVGHGFWCKVNLGQQDTEAGDSEIRAIPIELEPSVLADAKLTSAKKVPFSAVLPGNRLEATVQKVEDEGLVLHFLKAIGNVHKSQLPKKPNLYKKGQTVTATVLYVHPVSKAVDLTLRPCLSAGNGCPQAALLSAFAVGDFVEGSVLSTNERGVLFRLGPQYRGFATIGNLSDAKVENVAKEFKKGATYRCRVIDFDPMEELVCVTLKKSIVEAPVLNIKDVHIGQEIEVEVTKVSMRDIEVRVGRGMTGHIPAIHAADVLLSQLNKKFKEGDKLKCRVWQIDRPKSRMTLTHKKSLVNPGHAIISSFDQLTPGLLFDGVIAQVNNNGALVVTFNNVKGWVPVTELAWDRVEFPHKLFHVGQVVACRVLSVDNEKQKALFSFKLDTKSSDSSTITSKKTKTRAEPPEDFVPGKIVQCVVTHKTADGLDVKLTESGKMAFLPKLHLSDWPDLCDAFYNVCSKGTTLDVMYYNISAATTIVTRKQVFFQAAAQGSLITKFEDLEPGLVVPAVVKSHKDYGMFVELPGGLFGLTINQYGLDKNKRDIPLAEAFPVSLSVMAKVLEVKPDKERFLVSTRLSDTGPGGDDQASQLLQQLLTEMLLLQKMASQGAMKAMAKLRPGSMTKVKVTAVTENGILCQLPGKVKGLAVTEHIEGCELKEGDEVEAVVLLVDWASEFVQVLLSKPQVKAVAHLKENKKTKVKPGQLVKAEVVLVKDDMVLTLLKGHAAGRLAYLPRKTHLNDVRSRQRVTFGQVVQVEIDRVEQGQVMARLPPQQSNVSLTPVLASRLSQSSLQPGAKVEARILKIYPQQMNIDINGVHGRVHITEIVDELEEGKNPMSKFKKNQKILVKVLGYRELKTHKFLPITHSDATKAIPECTLRPSKLSSDVVESADSLNKVTFQPGQKVTGFVMKCSNCDIMLHLSPMHRGRLDLLSLTRRLQVLENPDRQYRSGTALHVTVDRVTDTGLVEVSKPGLRVDLAVGAKVPGVVMAQTPLGYRLRLPGGGEGLVTKAGAKFLKPGQLQQCYITKVNPKTHHCLLSLTKPRPAKEKKASAAKTGEPPVAAEVNGHVGEEKKTAPKTSKKRKRKDSTEMRGMDQDEQQEEVKEVKQMEERQCLSVGGDFWQDEMSAPAQDSSSEEEEEEDTKQPKKRLKRDTLAEEKRIQKLEASGRLLELSSPEEFERMVLKSPDSSMTWVAYMTYYLNMAEVDKARAVLERGLQTINYREETEKRNLWAAYLTLEATYGSLTALEKVFEKAVQSVKPDDLYLHLASLHSQAQRLEEAENVFMAGVKKCKNNFDMWMQFCTFCLEHDRQKLGEDMKNAAGNHLRPDEYLELVGRFAGLQYQHDDPEKGRNTFFKMLGAYPAKVKVWLQFLEAEKAAGNVDQIKFLLQKLESSDISKRKKDFITGKFQISEKSD